MHDMQEDWLVEFITLCADGETASRINGVEQLREVAWQLLKRAGRESLKKRTFRIFSTQMCGRRARARVLRKALPSRRQKDGFLQEDEDYDDSLNEPFKDYGKKEQDNFLFSNLHHTHSDRPGTQY